MFLICINYLPCAKYRELVLFVDDTTAILKSKSSTELFTFLPLVMKEMEAWFSENGGS